VIRLGLALACAGCLSKPDFPAVADPPVLDGHLAAGDKHVCAIDATTALACWGNNHEGELGVTMPDRTGTPLTLGGNWTFVSAGAQHTCGIQGGVVMCWGDAMPPTPITLPNAAVGIFAGGDGACATDAGGSLYCWGLVDPTSAPLTTPTQILPAGIAGPWQEVRISADHACALTTGGDVYCWGQDDLQQLGVVGGNLAVADAVQPTMRHFLTLAVGRAATCGITTDHTLDCWGAPFATGGDMPSRAGGHPSAVIEIDSTPTWSGVAVGTAHVCGISDHGVRCYGSDSRGALGDDFATRAMLSDTVVVEGTLEVVAGDGFTCTRQDDDSKQCWGTNERGELGNGEIATEPLPVVIDIGGAATHLTVGDSHTCATRADNVVMCWGDNRLHQVSAPSKNDFEPAPVQASVGADLVAAGSHHTCAREIAQSTITCWGDHSLLQTGGGVAIVAPSPSLVWTAVSAGADATCAIAGDSTLVCWGAVPTRTAPTSPVVMASKYLAVGVGPGFVTGVHMTTLSNDVVEWADASADCSLTGGAGVVNPEFIDQAGNDPTQFATAPGHACRMEGEVMIALDHTSTPQLAVPGSWATVAVGPNHACAIDNKTSKVMCWGPNEFGEVGNGFRFHANPVEVVAPEPPP